MHVGQLDWSVPNIGQTSINAPKNKPLKFCHKIFSLSINCLDWDRACYSIANLPKHNTKSGPMLWGEMYKFFRLTNEATANISNGFLEMLIILRVVILRSQTELTSSRTCIAVKSQYQLYLNVKPMSRGVYIEYGFRPGPVSRKVPTWIGWRWCMLVVPGRDGPVDQLGKVPGRIRWGKKTLLIF